MSAQERPRGRFWPVLGLGCLALLLLSGAALVVAAGIVRGRLDALAEQRERWAAEFEAKGYRKVVGKVIEIRREVTEPTVYVAEIVEIDGNVSTDIAIVALSADVKGCVAGTLSFRGQMLVVQPSAVIGRNLDVVARFTHLLGTIKGRVVGDCRSISRSPLRFKLPMRPPEEI